MTDTITRHRQFIQEAIANNPHITEQPSHVSLAPWFSLHEAIHYAEQRGDHARIHQEAIIAHITDVTDASALKALGFSGPEATEKATYYPVEGKLLLDFTHPDDTLIQF